MLQAQSTKAGETALAGAVEFFRGCWFGVWFFGGNCCDWGQDLLLGFQLEIHRNHQPDMYIYIYTLWGPQTIAKLLNITPITMVYDNYNDS